MSTLDIRAVNDAMNKEDEVRNFDRVGNLMLDILPKDQHKKAIKRWEYWGRTLFVGEGYTFKKRRK